MWLLIVWLVMGARLKPGVSVRQASAELENIGRALEQEFPAANRGKGLRALKWLLLDAVAPLLGVASTYLYTLSDVNLGIVLSIFCGFFLYIGASDLLPESHHRHPKVLTGLMNILGATVIWLAIHFATL